MGFYLTYKHRRQLTVILVLLLLFDIAMVLLALGIIVVVGLSLSQHSGPVRPYDATLTPMLLGSICFAHLLLNIYEIEGWLHLRRRMLRYTTELSERLQTQIVAVIVLIIVLVIAVIMCLIGLATVEYAMKGRLLRYMQAYRFNILAKEQMDILQSSFECCGRHGFKDWFEINWISPRFQKYISSHSIVGENDHVPFSCCDSRALRPCVHYGVETVESHYKYDPDVDLTLFRVGCRTVISSYIRQVHIGFTVQFLWLIFLKGIILCLSRLLFTSQENACVSGDSKATSFAYFFSGPSLVLKGTESELPIKRKSTEEVPRKIRSEKIIHVSKKRSKRPPAEKIASKVESPDFPTPPTIPCPSPAVIEPCYPSPPLPPPPVVPICND